MDRFEYRPTCKDMNLFNKRISIFKFSNITLMQACTDD